MPTIGSTAVAAIAGVVGILLGVAVDQLIGYIIDCARPKAPNRPTGPIVPRCSPIINHGQPLVKHGQPTVPHGQPLVQHGQPITQPGQPLVKRGQPISEHGQPIVKQGHPLANKSLPMTDGRHHQDSRGAGWDNTSRYTLHFDVRDCQA